MKHQRAPIRLTSFSERQNETMFDMVGVRMLPITPNDGRHYIGLA
jgi:hypothetical protein